MVYLYILYIKSITAKPYNLNPIDVQCDAIRWEQFMHRCRLEQL